jgi:hypothetical protein
MNSTSIFNILSASTFFALIQAASIAQETRSTLAKRDFYSKCKLPSGLLWDGTCSIDPCGQWISWCPDYEYGTWNPIKKDTTVSPEGKPQVAPETPATTGGLIYSQCTLPSGLRWDGYCSRDPCGLWQPWCVDYEFGTDTPKRANNPVESEPKKS